MQIQKSFLRPTLNMFIVYVAACLNVRTNQRRYEELLNFFFPNNSESNKINNKMRNIYLNIFKTNLVWRVCGNEMGSVQFCEGKGKVVPVHANVMKAYGRVEE